VWPVGIDTDKFTPARPERPFSVIVYDKISMHHEKVPEVRGILQTVLSTLKETGVPYHLLTYGSYYEQDFLEALQKTHGFVFLSQHESQGIAALEAMSAGVPILAWNPGRVLEENWQRTARTWPIPATSVPYFDERCGTVFEDSNSFRQRFAGFRAAHNYIKHLSEAEA
jgi:glycosyltransferase involved in cell wall biosynthesis